VAIGFGKRSDFTKTLSVKADFTYNYDQMYTLKSELDKKKQTGTQKNTTFGVPYTACHKAVISEAPHFSRVDVCKTDHMGYDELKSSTIQTMRSPVRLPKMTTDRGLLSPSRV
jgi:hypothetical protein